MPKPFDSYYGDEETAFPLIMCFKSQYEKNIFKYYSKERFWLKHKNDLYFLLIEKEHNTIKNERFKRRTDE